MKKNYSVSLSKSKSLAKEIAAKLKGGEILALSGPLGSGKTTFAKALAQELGVTTTVASPTFVLMNRYQASLKDKNVYLYHLDLYRTNSLDEVMHLGLSEIWGKPETVTVIEWADKISKILPSKTIHVHFSHD